MTTIAYALLSVVSYSYYSFRSVSDIQLDNFLWN